MSNTKPPTEPATRSRWTARDEADLVERVERKRRIMEENRGPVVVVAQAMAMNVGGAADILADELIANAAAVRAALRPFDEEGRV